MLEIDYNINHRILRKHEIHTGDLLFFHGTDRESQLIERGTASPWSHTGTAVRLQPKTVALVKKFITSLPKDWRSVSKHFLKHVEGLEAKELSKSGKISLGPKDICRREHLVEVLVAMVMLDNNTIITKAIEEECDIELAFRDSKRPELYRTDDPRELYMWESTTAVDDPAICVLSGVSKPGVKLTIMDIRASGYPEYSPVGRRRLWYNPPTYQSYKNMLSTLIVNFIINFDKPYELNYTSMIDAWTFGNCCCPDIAGNEGCYMVGRLLHYLCCCWCYDGAASASYHYPIAEYDSLYCSELATEVLYDYDLYVIYSTILGNTSVYLREAASTMTTESIGLDVTLLFDVADNAGWSYRRANLLSLTQNGPIFHAVNNMYYNVYDVIISPPIPTNVIFKSNNDNSGSNTNADKKIIILGRTAMTPNSLAIGDDFPIHLDLPPLDRYSQFYASTAL